MSHQEALTLVAPIDPTRLDSLKELFLKMQREPSQKQHIPFSALPDCHFGRLLCWEATLDLKGDPLDAQLLLLTDCDGSSDAHLQRLVEAAGGGVDAVFSHCKGYPRTPASSSDRLRYLERHRVRESAHYVHRPGRTVKRIRGEARLYLAIEALVEADTLRELPASELRERIQKFVAADPELSWALDAPEPLELGYRARQAIDRVARPLALLALAPILTPAAALALGLIRLQEERERPAHVRPSAELLRSLTELEDHAAHNAYTTGGFIKPGVLRRVVLRSILKVVDYGVRHLFAEDSLAGVKSIHFARWIPMDGGRRMIFASNYDGTVESYNDDFINLVGWGLNLIFSNGLDYPSTRWLVCGGASREQEFKDCLRCHQIPTPVWYSAYPQLTALHIERNSRLRDGLRGDMTEEEAQAWLHLL